MNDRERLAQMEGVTVAVAQPLPGLPYLVCTVNGPGYSVQLRFRDDGRLWDSDDEPMLAALTDEDANADRLWQQSHPELAGHVGTLRAAGYTVEAQHKDGALTVKKGKGKPVKLTPAKLAEAAGKVTPEALSA